MMSHDRILCVNCCHMSDTMKLAVLGPEDSIGVFAAVGVECVPVSDAAAGVTSLKALCENGGYAAVFVQEQTARLLGDEFDRITSTVSMPAILVIPGVEASAGDSHTQLKKIIEQAIGSDIPNVT